MDKLPELDKPCTEKERIEIDSILQEFGGLDGMREIYRLIEGQHTVVHTRAQSLIQLSGVIITVTGFSGRIIADTNTMAQVFIITGLVFVLAAAAIAILRVLPIRWMSSYMHLEMSDWLLVALRRRERKSRAFTIASYLLIVGMVFYIAAIAIMLLNPELTELHRTR